MNEVDICSLITAAARSGYPRRSFCCGKSDEAERAETVLALCRRKRDRPL
ncbi:hypothetical protein KCP69_17595 [Salmonella enterica subsp. enterica]|nr:hypothetical protein KCP69_17595 [Salmonella enterica subsp. enterica]